MKLSQIFTAPNQLTLLRMVFVPFIVIELVEGRYFWALILFVIAGFSDGLDGLLVASAEVFGSLVEVVFQRAQRLGDFCRIGRACRLSAFEHGAHSAIGHARVVRRIGA